LFLIIIESGAQGKNDYQKTGAVLQPKPSTRQTGGP
jgi:hypothetical protein